MEKSNIVLFDNPVLRQVARAVTVFKEKLHSEIDLLKNTLLAEQNGAAVAANQVSLLKRIVVINYLGEYLEMVNPRILSASGEIEDEEGCLSLPGYFGVVPRASEITVRFRDRQGKQVTMSRSDRMARCMQHEIDHLDGILFIDRMPESGHVTNEQGEELAIADILARTPARKAPAQR